MITSLVGGRSKVRYLKLHRTLHFVTRVVLLLTYWPLSFAASSLARFLVHRGIEAKTAWLELSGE